MIYSVEEIKKELFLVREYGVISFGLFGSYAKGTADEDSDLDFVMDKGDLKGLIQYISW